jgi:hypothetical protein
MIQEILTYKKIVHEIDDLIKKSPYKKNYIIKQVGIPGPTFYRKLKTNSFTVDEILSIAKILSPEEFFIMELTAELNKARLDVEEGRIMKHEDMMVELKNKRNNY